MKLFFKMLMELIRIRYEIRKDYWKYRTELEIYKRQSISKITEDEYRNIGGMAN